jgi:putative membrane protein
MLLDSPIFFGGLMLVVGLAVVAAVVRLITSRSASRATPPTDHACDILGERYLRGEITTEEYRDRRGALR